MTRRTFHGGALLLPLAMAVSIWARPVAAHDLVATKLVNGQSSEIITAYPATLTFRFTVTNVHPTLPSVLLTAEDPLLAPFGWSFTPAPPVEIPVGGSLTYEFPVTVNSYQDCLNLRAGSIPVPGTTFINDFNVTFDSGSSQSSVPVFCLETDQLACDQSYYVARNEGSGSTSLHRLDPATGALSLVGTSPLRYNAMGYNPITLHLYAIASEPTGTSQAQLVRIGATGAATVVATLPATYNDYYVAGDFLPDGSLAVVGQLGGHLLRVSTSGAVLSNVPISGAYSIQDLASTSTSTPVFTAYDELTQLMVEVNATTGAKTNLPGPTLVDGLPAVGLSMPSAFYTSASGLFFQGNEQGNAATFTHFYSADSTVGTLVTAAGTEEMTVASDGAICKSAPAAAVGATRDYDFFAARSGLVRQCLSGGPLALDGPIRSAEELLGVLWADPATHPELRVETARAWLAAVCSERLFGTPTPRLPPAPALLNQEPVALRETLRRLDAHNASGALRTLPRALRVRPDVQAARASAREPSFLRSSPWAQ